MKKIFCGCVFFLLIFFVFAQVNVHNANQIKADEEFRRGVQAYYRGSFNEAILEFEKAVSLIPENNVYLDWLGKAYYRSGLESTALQEWNYASQAGYGGLLLQKRIEIVKERRVAQNFFDKKTRYVESGSYAGSEGKTLRFSQPMSILSEANGTIWVCAYGSNELIQIDVNGNIINRQRGPLNGFDRPMDIIRNSDGSFLVTEYAGDRISVLDSNGKYKKSFGSKGSGIGNVLGPQYMALDESGRLYVTDFGNARVSVFDTNGNGLFTFGRSKSNFSGFKAPTGIIIIDGLIYVADAVTGAIYTFDASGNYIRCLVKEKSLNKPEALKYWNGSIICADSNKVLAIDVSSGAISEIAKLGNAPVNIVCASSDVNGNLIVSDLKNNDVYVLTKMDQLVGGLFVQIERVIADSFPNIIMDVRVENTNRQPIVGLKAKNFLVTEKLQLVTDQKLTGASYVNNICDITIIVDRLTEAKKYTKELETCVREIAQGMNDKGTLSIVTCGELPVAELKGNPKSFLRFEASMLKNQYAKKTPVDLAIRLAGNALINAESKRAVVFVTTGETSIDSFSHYSYSETASWLNNNGIAFMSVLLNQSKKNEEIDYLTKQTPGNQYYVYRNEGLKCIASDLCALPNGHYRLSFVSKQEKNFGLSYLPVEVEVYLQNRSGRDESGYFAPLE